MGLLLLTSLLWNLRHNRIYDSTGLTSILQTFERETKSTMASNLVIVPVLVLIGWHSQPKWLTILEYLVVFAFGASVNCVYSACLLVYYKCHEIQFTKFILFKFAIKTISLIQNSLINNSNRNPVVFSLQRT